MAIDLDKEIELMKSTNILTGKILALQGIKQRFEPLLMLPKGTISKESFDTIMDSYHYGLTGELENIQARQEILK